MKNIKNLFLGLLIISLSSCLKADDMNIDAVKYKTNVIEIANTGDNLTNAGVSGFYSDLGVVAAGASKTFNINIHYTGPGNAPNDITVTLSSDAATLATYNTQNGVTKVAPPASVVSFPTSVVIKKGTNLTTVEGKITVSSDFNFSAAYGIPVKISKVSEGIVSGNFGNAVYSFGVRNRFDGSYTVTGTMVDYANAGLTGRYPMSVGMVTSGANTVRLYDNVIGGVYHSISTPGLSYYGAFGVEFAIDASNNITSVINVYGQPASNGRSAELDPSGVNKYDPATKTFKVKYWMNQPSVIAGHRCSFDETIKYTGVR
jgi:hypothetical protein